MYVLHFRTQGEEDETSTINSSVSTQTEPPPRGVSDLWGLDQQIDKWQVSAMPEEKHYFSMDVSYDANNSVCLSLSLSLSAGKHVYKVEAL